jgi:hypothetical protein
MAIYSSWGREVVILSVNFDRDTDQIVIKTKAVYGNRQLEYHPSELKADGGWQEIEDAIVAVNSNILEA